MAAFNLRLNRMSMIFMIAIVVSFFFACDKGSDSPRRGDMVGSDNSGPGSIGGERPDTDGDFDYSPYFRDAVWRYVGEGIDLRYDRGGVLFKSLSDGVSKIIDLDGTAHIELRLGKILKDSTLPDAVISVNGRKLEGIDVRMKKQTAEAVWYDIKNGEKHTVLVLP